MEARHLALPSVANGAGLSAMLKVQVLVPFVAPPRSSWPQGRPGKVQMDQTGVHAARAENPKRPGPPKTQVIVDPGTFRSETSQS